MTEKHQMLSIPGDLIVKKMIKLKDGIHIKGNLQCEEIISDRSIIVDGSIRVKKITSNKNIICSGKIEAYFISAKGKITSEGSIVCEGLIHATTIIINKNSNVFYGKLEGKIIRK